MIATAERPSILARGPGVHLGVSAAEYHERKLGVVSKSALDLVHRSPLHYLSWVRWELDAGEESAALAFGRAFHAALLEPDDFSHNYAVLPDFGDCRFKEAKARRDAWREENEGRIEIPEADGSAISAMVDAIRRHPLAGKALRDGEAETTFVWKDETGLTCKSRTDYWVPKRAMLVDVKTTLDASEAAFKKSIAKYRYHVQDALYRFAASAVGETVQHFVFVAVEKNPPYAVGVYALDAHSIGVGYSAAREDINTLAECLARDEWPGYPVGIREITIPPWSL